MNLLQGNTIIYSRKSLGKTSRARDIIQVGNFEKVFVISDVKEYDFDNVEYLLNKDESLYESIQKLELKITNDNLLIIDDFQPLVLSDEFDNIGDDNYGDIYDNNYKELLCNIMIKNNNKLKTIFIIQDIKDFPDIFKNRCNTMLTYF